MTIKTLSRTPPHLPAPFDATPSSLIQDGERLIKTTQQVWQDIVFRVKRDEATFENVILPIIRDDNVVRNEARVLKFYSSTSPSQDLREASNAATKLLNDAEIDLYLDAGMFRLVSAVADKIKAGDCPGLDDESVHYVFKLHHKLLVNGCGIEDPVVKKGFENAQKRIQVAARQSINNINNDPSGIWLTADELDGVSDRILAPLAIGEGEHEGQYWLKTKLPHPTKTLSHAKKEATRKKLYYAIKNRLPDNVALHRELVLLRDETARTLGFPNFMALKTADKMAGNPETVLSGLNELRTRLRPHTEHAASQLLDMKMEDVLASGGDAKNVRVFCWDSSYYGRIYQESQKQSSSSTDVSEYFELRHTLEGLLKLYNHLFETRFERITPEQQRELSGEASLVWHDDVEMYAVWDDREAEAFLGYVYMDFFPREGKYNHRGCYNTRWSYENEDGSRIPASVALVMNYIKTSDGRPTLLDLSDTRSLFHELGHVHQSLCVQSRHAELGHPERDWGEAPCMMLEQFFWQEHHIKAIAFHYSHISPELKDQWKASQTANGQALEQPEAELSEERASELAASRTNFETIINQATQLFYGLYDAWVYAPETHKDIQEASLVEVHNKLRAELTQLAGGEAVGDGWDWSHGEATLRNMIDNYAGGYYTYVLGRVYALDMFKTHFQQDTMSKEAGRRFRDMVLAIGGRQPEMKTLREYLGHEPSSEAYFEWLGM